MHISFFNQSLRLLSIAYLLIILLACNKEYSFEKSNPVVSNPSFVNIIGLYEGRFGYGQSNNDSYYSFQFISNNQILVNDGIAVPSRPGKGVYSLTDREITGYYQYSNLEKFSIKAKFSNDFTNLIGTWWETAAPTNKGNFEIKKK